LCAPGLITHKEKGLSAAQEEGEEGEKLEVFLKEKLSLIG
jgi:hypothetical protein